MSTATIMLVPVERDARSGRAGSAGPGPFVVRLGNGRPAHAVYVRRRLLVGLVVTGLLTVLGVSAHSVLADRGGVPASTPVVRPVNIAAAATPSAPVPTPVGTPYIVQPGDTLWSLGELYHGTRSVASYVDALVAANGGASLQVGQLLTLP